MILELQTDRGNAVLEMPFRGWIAAQHVRPGDTIDLDAPLLTIVPAQTGRMREVRYHVRGDNPRDIPLPLIASHQVGEDGYFFLGDNSPASQDGRVWGDVVRRNLVGEAHVVFWPLSRWRMIR
jgi:signal peptidase I